MQRLLFLFVLLGTMLTVQGQNKIYNIKVKKTYPMGPITDVYNDITKKYGLKFVYDSVAIGKLRGGFWFDNASLFRIMESTLAKTNYAYYLNSDSTTVFIISKSEFNERAAAPPQKTYTGKAEKTNISLTGKLVDKLTGEPLPFAYIFDKNKKAVASTNVDGYFTLLNVPTDTSTIVVQYIGYKTKELFLTPKTELNNMLIEVELDARKIEEVLVKGDKEIPITLTDKNNLIKLDPQKLTKLPSMGEKDIFRSFQLMPGVGGSNESSSGLYVNGGTPDQNLVIYDGFTVYHVEHLFGFYSAFNPNALKDVQLHKGGFESKFGGRISSVSEIIGKEGNKKKFSAGGDISLLSANLFAEGPINKKTTFLLAGRRSYQGFLYDKIFEQYSSSSSSSMPKMPGGMGAQEITPKSFFYDLNARLTYKPTAKDIFSWSIYNGTDKLDNSRTMEMPQFEGSEKIRDNDVNDFSKWGNTGSSLKWSRKWSEQFYSNSLLSYSNYFYTKDRSSTMTTTDEDGNTTTVKRGNIENNDLKDFSFKLDNEWIPTHNHKVEFGLNAAYNQTLFDRGTADTAISRVNENSASTVSLYVQDKIGLFKNRLSVTPGVRYSYYTGTGKHYIEPRLSGNYKITEDLKIKASWGIYNQFVKRIVHEDILTGSTSFWALADNGNLPVSHAVHYIGGASYAMGDYLFELDAYFKDMTGLTEYTLSLKPGLGGGTGEESFYEGTGTARGVNMIAQKTDGKFTGWVGYSLGQVVYDFPEISAAPYYASHDVQHEFKVVNQYKLNNYIDFSAIWIFASGKPFTEVEGYYQVELVDGSTRDYFTASAKNGARLPAYHRLDLAVNLSWRGDLPFDKCLSLSVFNVYNRTNIWYKEYTVTDENQVVTTNVNYLGITPNLTFSFKF